LIASTDVTHYDTLEVSPQASPEVVRAAFKSLIQRSHPDRNPGDSTLAARAVAINEAYGVLSDIARRAAYDERLAQGRTAANEYAVPSSAQLAPPRRAGPTHRAPPAGPGLTAWVLGLAAAAGVIWGAVWLASPRADERSELLTIRSTYARGGVPELRLRELYARKEELLRQVPELQVAAAAERASNRGGRTIDLLDAPLVVQLEKGELTIPRLRVVLGSFNTANLRAYTEKNRERLGRELAENLTRLDATKLGPGGTEVLTSLMVGTLARGMGTRPEEELASTFFESPGRHGAIEVLLPEGYTLRIW
jgi:curved DNA-binding protein CbpA